MRRLACNMRRQIHCAGAALILSVGLAICAGCEQKASLVSVEGLVTLNSKPLANATVLFSPTRASGAGPFVGTTNNEGRFVLGPVDNPGGGAAAAEYMVMITTVKQDPKSIDGAPVDPTQKEVVPAAYRDGSKRFTVPPGGATDANFPITTR
jgi:hypothetical protein